MLPLLFFRPRSQTGMLTRVWIGLLLSLGNIHFFEIVPGTISRCNERYSQIDSFQAIFMFIAVIRHILWNYWFRYQNESEVFRIHDTEIFLPIDSVLYCYLIYPLLISLCHVWVLNINPSALFYLYRCRYSRRAVCPKACVSFIFLFPLICTRLV